MGRVESCDVTLKNFYIWLICRTDQNAQIWSKLATQPCPLKEGRSLHNRQVMQAICFSIVMWRSPQTKEQWALNGRLISWEVATGEARRSYPVYAEQRAGLAEDADDLLDLAVAHPLADATKHHQCPRLERRVVLEREPGTQRDGRWKPCHTTIRDGTSLKVEFEAAVLLSQLRPLVQPLAGWDVPHARLEERQGRTSKCCLQNTAPHLRFFSSQGNQNSQWLVD